MTSVAEKLQRKEQRKVATKQVRLKLVYIDFWSVVKLSFLDLAVPRHRADRRVRPGLGRAQLDRHLRQARRHAAGHPRRPRLPRRRTPSASIQVGAFSLVVALLNTVVGTVLGAIAALLYNLSVRFTGGLLVGFQNS